MIWRQVRIFTTTEGIEPLCGALMELDVSGFSIQDSSDFEEFLKGKQGRWDYIDDDLLRMRECESCVTFYLDSGEQGGDRLSKVESFLARIKTTEEARNWGRLELEVSDVEEESWENSWKQYYKPTKVGEKLVVCPTWEPYDATPDEVVIRLDPGMAFGTGTHDSTRLCLGLMEKRLRAGDSVLDLGCGSGILAVGALLLGAESALGVDIDEVAVRVAEENAAINGVSGRARFLPGNLTSGINGRYNLILANIVADVILQLIPDLPGVFAPGGALITSGIIDSRAAEVEEALRGAGLSIADRVESGGWVAFTAVGI